MVVISVINSRPFDTIALDQRLAGHHAGSIGSRYVLASCLGQKRGQMPAFRISSPPLATIPVVLLSADLILLVTIPLLDFALELIATAIDHIEIVVCELPPLFLDVAFELLPVSFNSVPIHRFPPPYHSLIWRLS